MHLRRKGGCSFSLLFSINTQVIDPFYLRWHCEPQGVEVGDRDGDPLSGRHKLLCGGQK